MKSGVPVNDDQALEKEADVMGQRALQAKSTRAAVQIGPLQVQSHYSVSPLAELESAAMLTTNMAWGLVKSVLRHEMANASYSTIINSLLKAGDSFVSNKIVSWSGLSSLAPGINMMIVASKAALAMWDSLSDNIKTGLLYVMGVMAAKAPIIRSYKSLQGFIVSADQGEVRGQVQGWVNTAQTGMKYFTAPLTSFYQYLTGSSKEEPQPEAEAVNDETAQADDAEKLINLNLQVITLMINNLKLGYDKKSELEQEQGQGTQQQDPGLIVEFFVQLKLFGSNIPERAGQEMDQLFFPFSGEFKYTAGSPIIINNSDRTLLGNTLGPVSIYPLVVAKSGVKSAGLNIDKLIVGNGIVILTNAKGAIQDKLLSLSTDAELNIGGYQLSGSMSLLMNDGAFESLSITNVNEAGNFKLKAFNIDKSYNGDAAIQIDQLDIIKDTLSVANVQASASVAHKKFSSFDFSIETFLLNLSGSSINVTGAYLSYVRADPAQEIDENIKGGAAEINANINGVNVILQNLLVDKNAGIYEFSSGLVRFPDFDILVEQAALKNGGIEITKAALSIPKYQLEGSVNTFTWNKDGLDFESISLAFPGKTLSPMESVVLSNMSIELKKGGGYELILTSDIALSPAGGAQVIGAQGVALNLSKEGISGTLSELNVNTSMFDVLIKEAEFNKERIGAAEAGIKFKSKEEGGEYGKIMPIFDTGLLDFLNLGTELKVKNAYFYKGKGFSIDGVYPNLKALKFKLFGFEATADPENRSIAVKGSLDFPGTGHPFWPFSQDIAFPIFIGVAGHFGLELGGYLTLDIDTTVQREKGQNKPYNFSATPSFAGDLYFKVSAGAELGARLAVALQANIFAQTNLSIQSKAELLGSFIYVDRKFTQEKPVEMSYELKNMITAVVGGELKLKAFLFYDKQLTQVKFKDWELGEWVKSGKIGSSAEGAKLEDKERGKFTNSSNDLIIEKEIIEGARAQELLQEANLQIIGSGEERERMITKLTVDMSKVAHQLLVKQKKAKQELIISESRLKKIHGKNKNINEAALKKQEEIDQRKKNVANHEKELNKVLSLMNNVVAGLEAKALEQGTGNTMKRIESIQNDIENIDQSINEPHSLKSSADISERQETEAEDSALKPTLSSIVVTPKRWVEISSSKSMGFTSKQSKRNRIIVVDRALEAYEQVRNESPDKQLPKLEALLYKVNTYLKSRFSSRIHAAQLLQYQVEQAIKMANESRSKRTHLMV
ncbi:hypothetical protein LVD15_21335 [Fulvivirga maritima]|uniref:hypothetical protein n=1 Tax=Fulvivirga maritima TaxID=2904247 RepID=UPI001F234F6F|nr:hypothetical protein [Fulvivirga maritima]UII25820.1 hypothetical protein LVD15_21335 [Fulvivirga maritima]